MNKNKRTRSNLDIVYTILDFARLILITVVAAMVILVFVARKEEVRGTSMYPTLVEGESVIINMAANYVGEIKRFDVVVAREYRSVSSGCLEKRSATVRMFCTWMERRWRNRFWIRSMWNR